MNKSLIAAALAATFVAPAIAQENTAPTTGTSTSGSGMAFSKNPGAGMGTHVTIYGRAAASLDYIDTDSAQFNDVVFDSDGNGLPDAIDIPEVADDKLRRVSNNTSILGFKGAEDLGGGLKGIWQIEQVIDLTGDTGNSGTGFGTRDTFIGVAHDMFGTLRIGRYNSPYKSATRALDIFHYRLGDYRNIIGNVNGFNLYNNRNPNSLTYTSPSFSGFTVAAQIAALTKDEQPNVSDNTGAGDRAYSVSALYDNGPLFGSLAYERREGFTPFDVTATNVANGFGNPFVIPTGPTADSNGLKLGLGFTIAGFKLGFVAERLEEDDISSTVDRDAYYVSAAYAMGNNVLKAAYGIARDSDAPGDDEGQNFTVGLDHNFSKRTTVYALYSRVENDALGKYGLGTGISPSGAGYTPAGRGRNPQAISLGLEHKF